MHKEITKNAQFILSNEGIYEGTTEDRERLREEDFQQLKSDTRNFRYSYEKNRNQEVGHE